MPPINTKLTSPATSAKDKIFVLDTSVILYDHNAIKNFQEHNIAIPIQVLEELDKFKEGNETRNFEAREFIRFVDRISKKNLINDWIPLDQPGKGQFKVILDSNQLLGDSHNIFENGKYDHKILNAAISLQRENTDKKVVLVTKDICLRLKAKALNLPAEDYETGKIKDLQKLDTGMTTIRGVSNKLIDKFSGKMGVKPSELQIDTIPCNHFLIAKNGRKEILARYDANSGKMKQLSKKEVFRIKARNPEQAFALDALTNPNISLVTLQGVAGTGKTLLALASALEQRKNYRQIFITSPVIPLSNQEVGFLPGDIKAKLNPYLQAMWDNLNYIKEQFKPGEKTYSMIDEMIQNEKISIAPLAYIRGRSLSKVFFIVDEAQNLTPHEVKTIISRAGDNTKIVFTGDIYQIDTPYLDSQSNGLSYLIDKVKGHPLFAHITLEKGVRSELANLANELL